MSEEKSLKSILVARQEMAYNRLKNNPKYVEVCKRQLKTEEVVEEFLHRFSKEDRIAIRRHYEGETERQSLEIDEVYVQGLRDSVTLLTFLGIFDKMETGL